MGRDPSLCLAACDRWLRGRIARGMGLSWRGCHTDPQGLSHWPFLSRWSHGDRLHVCLALGHMHPAHPPRHLWELSGPCSVGSSWLLGGPASLMVTRSLPQLVLDPATQLLVARCFPVLSELYGG